MPRQYISEEKKRDIMKSYENGVAVSEIWRSFGLKSRQTAHQIIAKYRKKELPSFISKYVNELRSLASKESKDRDNMLKGASIGLFKALSECALLVEYDRVHLTGREEAKLLSYRTRIHALGIMNSISAPLGLSAKKACEQEQLFNNDTGSCIKSIENPQQSLPER
jgi:transposase-like protein